MKLVSLLFAFLGIVPAFAGVSSAVIVLPTESPRPAPAVSLTQPADYLCAVISLRNAAKDPERQANAMHDALQRVTSVVEKSTRYQLHLGPVRLAGTAGTSVVKNSSSVTTLQTSLRILSPLGGNTDIFDAMKDLRKFIATLQTADDTDLTITSMTLAVAAPEQYRERLLALIADQSRTIQQTLGARSIAFDGLQNAVAIRQLDDANVEIYIDYLLSATVESR
jgi:hypothetical protein